jgi:hypothetical protein
MFTHPTTSCPNIAPWLQVITSRLQSALSQFVI